MGKLAPPEVSHSAEGEPSARASAAADGEPNRFARLTGVVESTLWPTRPKWRSWGRQNLQTGDLVFIRSNYRILLGTFNLSRFLAEVADSPYSHVGLVVLEQGRPMVFDASDKGVKAQPFENFVTDGAIERFAVRRLRPEHRYAIPAAIAFAKEHEKRETRFDDRFATGDEKLYCTELVAEAFKRGGVTLSQPTPVAELPGLDDVSPVALQMAKWATHLSEGDLVWLPGNHHHGLFASPCLLTVHEH